MARGQNFMNYQILLSIVDPFAIRQRDYNSFQYLSSLEMLMFN